MAVPEVIITAAMSFTFGTSAYAFWIREITPPTLSTEKIDTTHQETANHTETFIPSWFTGPGEYQFTCFHEPDAKMPLVLPHVIEEITVQYPAHAGYSAGTKLVFDGFLMNYAPDGVFNGAMAATCTVAISGIKARTAAAAE